MNKQLTKQLQSGLGIFLVFTAMCGIYAQTSTENTKVPLPDIEKTYLHTDRSYYQMGESLWYKAYNVYAYNHVLFDKSSILYVELINSDSKIVARHKTQLKAGLGHGDFILADSTGVTPGTYQLRGYTNWNRNFGDDFIFKKKIEILDVFNREGDVNEISKTKSKNIERLKTADANIDVQFFPEGGSLIENVISVIAFKAVDAHGHPITIEGKVFNSAGALINLFKSEHDGMGKFQFKPEPGETYSASVNTVNGVSLTVDLPKTRAKGYVLQVKTYKDRDLVIIKTNTQTLKEPLTIIGSTRGITYFETSVSLTKNTLSFELPKSNFPDGICQITLYDGDLRPQSERLWYIENTTTNVQVTTDKTIYKSKEQVSLHISSKSTLNEVLPASYSLSCTDMNSVDDIKDYGMSISSYFLMESDIKGKVFHPGYYFDRSNSRRLYALDLLLLTQGWRDFLWKKLPVIKDSLTYKAEKGFTISGHVKQLFGKKPKVNSSVTLALLGKLEANVFTSVTDSLGSFKFKDLMFTGPTNMLLNNRTETGKNSGMFLLDSLELPPISARFKASILLEPQQKKIQEQIYKKHIAFGVAPENVLDEVEIIVKKKNDVTSLYGPADNTYVIDENSQYFNNIYLLIQYAIPGVSALGNQVGFNRYNGRPAYILVDGVPWEQGDLANFQTDDIAKIEGFRGPSAALFGVNGGNGVIVLYTKTGDISPSTKKKFHSIKKEIEGFYNARVFYVPNEKDTFETDKSADIRNTLYWNPYVHPDETGNVKVSYPNSAVETQVKVTLEGLTVTGLPVVEKVYYTIQN